MNARDLTKFLWTLVQNQGRQTALRQLLRDHNSFIRRKLVAKYPQLENDADNIIKTVLDALLEHIF